MRSRAVRLTCSAAAWIALGAAAFFVVQSEKQIAARASAVRAFDVHAREAAGVLGDARVAQQAYVAAGQDNAFWMPKVASTTAQVTTSVASLREAATDAGTRAALDQAANTIALFGDIDKRAREYLKSSQPLMAADVIFTEGNEAAATAARSVEAARLAERQAADAADAAVRRREALAIGGAAGVAALIVLVLAPAGNRLPVTPERGAESWARDGATVGATDAEEWAGPASPAQPGPSGPSALPAQAALPGPPDLPALPDLPTLPALPTPPALPASPDLSSALPILTAAAELATDLGRVRDLDDLSGLLGRTAAAMDATGLVVWMGNLNGDDLRPLLAHGYSEQTLARMLPVARTDDNAAAAAYRSGHMQIVVSKPGVSGAIVAPILVPGGCIGALSAECRGAETSKGVQAFATIVAAHLATVLTTAPAESIETKAASG